MDIEHLFVYGTLRPGQKTPMGRWLSARSEYLGAAFVYGQLYDLGTYPGLILDKKAHTKVMGDVFRLPVLQIPALMYKLDQYEGIIDSPQSAEYKRAVVQAMMNSHSVPAWVYILNLDLTAYPFLKLITGADYAQYRRYPS